MVKCIAYRVAPHGYQLTRRLLVNFTRGVHAVIPKLIFDELAPVASTMSNRKLAGHESTNYKVPLSAANVHWGYFSKSLEPVLKVPSGSEVTIEMATHHACDDWDKMSEFFVG